MARKHVVAVLVFSHIITSLSSSAILLAQTEGRVISQGESKSGVEVTLRLVRRLPDLWEFELSAENAGSNAVFIMTDARRSNGSKGAYFALDARDPSILDIGIQLYPDPEYSIYANHAGITLKRLQPGAKHVEQITVSFPTRETWPPYKILPEMIDQQKVRLVRAAVAIIPDDEGVKDFLRRKEPIGPYASGLETIDKGANKGKALYEIQEIIRTPAINLSSVP